MQKVGVLGSGVVGQTLADGLLKHGYAVMRGSRDPSKMTSWRANAGPLASVGTLVETARFGDLIVLAVKGSKAVEALNAVGPESLAGKTVIDATNPIADEPPVDGVLRFFTGPNESLLERLQNLVPGARLVKAFSCVGHAFMVNPVLPSGPPTMFIAGNHDGAKGQVRELLQRFGWDVADMGTAVAARAIEPLCMLWCIPGLRENSWSHAFKLLRK